MDDILIASNSVSTPPLDPLVPSPAVPAVEENLSPKIPENLTAPAQGEFQEEVRTERDIGASGTDSSNSRHTYSVLNCWPESFVHQNFFGPAEFQFSGW